MKTKRIVALALAGVLAAGALTPAYAQTTTAAVDTTVTKEDTLAAYLKVYGAQKATVESAQKNVDEIKADLYKAQKALDSTRLELKKAEGTVQAKETALKDKEEEIEKKKEFIKKVEDNLSDAIKAYGEKYGEMPLGSSEAYEAEYQKAKKAGDDALAAKIWEKKGLYEQEGGIKDLTAKILRHQGSLQKMIRSLEGLKTNIDIAKRDADKAKAAYMAAEEKFVDLKVKLQSAEDTLEHEKVILTRIKEFKGEFTLESVKAETNPKLVKLASEDLVAYVLGRLAVENNYISKETLNKLGLADRVLNLYQDLLGDEGELKPAPEESKPENTDKEPEVTVPEDKPNTDDKKPEDKPNTDEKKPEDGKKDEEGARPDKKGKKDSKVAPKTGDVSVLAYAGTAVLAAGAFVASKKRK